MASGSNEPDPDKRLSALEELATRDDADNSSSGVMKSILAQNASKLDEPARIQVAEAQRAAARALGLYNTKHNGFQPVANFDGVQEMQTALGNRNTDPSVKLAILQAVQTWNKPTDPTVKKMLNQAWKYSKDPMVRDKITEIKQGVPLPVPF